MTIDELLNALGEMRRELARLEAEERAAEKREKAEYSRAFLAAMQEGATASKAEHLARVAADYQAAVQEHLETQRTAGAVRADVTQLSDRLDVWRTREASRRMERR
jgi:hypothetical protein